VLQLIRGAACVVFPSEFEGFGIPVIEAAWLKTKVVTSQLDVFREIGVPEECRIDFSDCDALARTLEDLTPRPLLRTPATWTQCAAQTLDVLREVATAMQPLKISDRIAARIAPEARLARRAA
jgi:glycosyltransferase involved in cell wall biosynthesis